MHYDIVDKLAVYASAIRGLKHLESNYDKQLKYLEFVDIYSKLSADERQQFEQTYQQEKQLMSGFNSAVMEQVRKEALLQGIQKGEQQGLGLGQRNTLIRQIKRRFGELPDAYLKQIDQARVTQLEKWLDNFVDAQTLEQVFQ